MMHSLRREFCTVMERYRYRKNHLQKVALSVSHSEEKQARLDELSTLSLINFMSFDPHAQYQSGAKSLAYMDWIHAAYSGANQYDARMSPADIEAFQNSHRNY